MPPLTLENLEKRPHSPDGYVTPREYLEKNVPKTHNLQEVRRVFFEFFLIYM